ncbi:MAG: cyclic pyranopterin monophosphate synthase MoaC [Actinobacteria bacterium]|nr:cyclic pyranopterin monophosphate synthase MoaC [Actinomycetota bacterium]
MTRPSHLDDAGQARMVDVGAKDITHRTARAACRVACSPATVRLIADGRLPKGDVVAIARIAGIQAAKRTSDLIPLCHAVSLTHVHIDVDVEPDAGTVDIVADAHATDRTGVEMEALTAAAVAALTVYDMVKSVESGVRITDLRLVDKTGGASGDWHEDHTHDRSAVGEPARQVAARRDSDCAGPMRSSPE